MTKEATEDVNVTVTLSDEADTEAPATVPIEVFRLFAYEVELQSNTIFVMLPGAATVTLEFAYNLTGLA